MDELISREKAVEALRDGKVLVTGMRLGKTILAEYTKQVREGYIDILEKVPTEDAVMVKYATWVDVGKTKYGTPIRMCSHCKITKAGKPKSNFCPDCGAAMRKKDEVDEGQMDLSEILAFYMG